MPLRGQHAIVFLRKQWYGAQARWANENKVLYADQKEICLVSEKTNLREN